MIAAAAGGFTVVVIGVIGIIVRGVAIAVDVLMF